MNIRHASIPLVVLMLAACANQQGRTASTSPAGTTAAPAAAAPAASPYGATRMVKSKDGRFDGEVVGTPGTKFSKLAIGMRMSEVTALIGGPDNMSRHETGKRWIPFYFGGDVQRLEVLYKGEGCLTYTGGNQFGGGGDELIRIVATSRADCLQ